MLTELKRNPMRRAVLLAAFLLLAGCHSNSNPPAPPPTITHFISLAWKAPVGGGSVTSYTVFRATASGAFTSYATGITATAYTDENVAAGVSYEYEVVAVGPGGTSPVSNLVVSTVP